MCRRKRKGISLLETMISLGIFALLMGIIVSLVALMISTTAEQKKASQRETESATFIYHLLTDMKSANSVSVESDLLVTYTKDDAHIYAFNDRTGVITRDDEHILRGYETCDLIPIDDSAFTLRFAMPNAEVVEMTIRCGAVEETEDVPQEEVSFDDD